ncbi:Uncharacterised protein [Enterobacter hormaechei]|nr:Uncharacterised protein [Enterobacter hormaechei]
MLFLSRNSMLSKGILTLPHSWTSLLSLDIICNINAMMLFLIRLVMLLFIEKKELHPLAMDDIRCLYGHRAHSY